jgi:DNA-directed RNA polymerase specialized sigma24 family protein
MRWCVGRALAEISASSREVLVLRYGDGLSHAEIAQLLGLRVDAVKQRASRALRELEGQLKHVSSQKGEMDLVDAETEAMTNARL